MTTELKLWCDTRSGKAATISPQKEMLLPDGVSCSAKIPVNGSWESKNSEKIDTPVLFDRYYVIHWLQVRFLKHLKGVKREVILQLVSEALEGLND